MQQGVACCVCHDSLLGKRSFNLHRTSMSDVAHNDCKALCLSRLYKRLLGTSWRLHAQTLVLENPATRLRRKTKDLGLELEAARSPQPAF